MTHTEIEARLNEIECQLKSFVHWKTVAGDEREIEDTPAPDIAWLVKTLRASLKREAKLREALEYYTDDVYEVRASVARDCLVELEKD